ncbi:MAG: MerR family transcriptional regulator [Holophagaceae bacterium]
MNASSAPAKRWFKIGEAAEQLGVKAKDLRYWESVIPEIRPRRSKGNLRYYHADELPRLTRIRDWVREGLSAVDCRGLLLTGQAARPLDLGLSEEDLAPSAKVRRPAPGVKVAADLQPAILALRELLARLGGPVETGGSGGAAPPSKPAPKRVPKPKPVLDPPPGLF